MTAVYSGTFYVRWEGRRTRTDGGWLGEMMDIIYNNNMVPVVGRISNLGELSAALTTEWPPSHDDGRYLSGNIPGGHLTFTIVGSSMHDKVELAEPAGHRRLGDIGDDGNFGILLGDKEDVDNFARAGEHDGAVVTIKANFQLFGDRGSLKIKT